MFKIKDLLGKPVVSQLNGMELGWVRDVMIDTEANRVVAIVLRKGGLFRDTQIVMHDQVQAYRDDMVVVWSELKSGRKC